LCTNSLSTSRERTGTIEIGLKSAGAEGLLTLAIGWIRTARDW